MCRCVGGTARRAPQGADGRWQCGQAHVRAPCLNALAPPRCIDTSLGRCPGWYTANTGVRNPAGARRLEGHTWETSAGRHNARRNAARVQQGTCAHTHAGLDTLRGAAGRGQAGPRWPGWRRHLCAARDEGAAAAARGLISHVPRDLQLHTWCRNLGGIPLRPLHSHTVPPVPGTITRPWSPSRRSRHPG